MRILVAAVVLVALLGVGVLALYVQGRGHLETIPAEALGLSQSGGERRNVLLVATEPEGTVALLQLRGEQETSPLVVLPSDLPVEVPGVGLGPLAEAVATGRPAVLVETVSRYTGLEVHHYAEVDLARLADIAGDDGLSACIDGRSTHLEPGEVAAAIGISEPRGVMTTRALLAEGMRPAVMANPVRAWGVLADLGSALRTDLRPRQVWDVVRAARATGDYPMALIEVPTEVVEGSLHVLPERAEALFQALREGGALPVASEPDPAGAAGSPVGTAAARGTAGEIDVLNGSGVAGAANRGAQELAGHGFDVVEVGNAERFDAQRTEIRHGPGDEGRARLLAAHLPGSVLVAGGDELERPVVILGRDRAEAEPITAAPQPQEEPDLVAAELSEECA